MNWHEFFFSMCETYSKKSKDLSTKVGCVIVGRNHEIRSGGYNGMPRRMIDDPSMFDPSGFRMFGKHVMVNAEKVKARFERPMKYLVTCHAEENAIINAARTGTSTEGCIMYVSSLPPCARCARMIIQSGITELHMLDLPVPERWKEETGIALEMLVECGVLVERHNISENVRNPEAKIDTVPSDTGTDIPDKKRRVRYVHDGNSLMDSSVPVCPQCLSAMAHTANSSDPSCPKCGLSGDQFSLEMYVELMNDELYKNYLAVGYPAYRNTPAGAKKRKSMSKHGSMLCPKCHNPMAGRYPRNSCPRCLIMNSVDAIEALERMSDAEYDVYASKGD